MKRLSRIGLLAAAMLLALWIGRALLPSEEARIRSLLADLAETAAIKPKATPLANLSAANKLGDFFTEDVTIQVAAGGYDARSINGRADLVQFAAAARASVPEASVTFDDIRVEVAPDRQTATALMTALARFGGGRDPWVEVLKMTLVKREGRWRISCVEAINTLAR